MSIFQTTEKEFTELTVGERCQSTWPRECERAWFTDAANHVIGVLLFDPLSKLWGYALCIQSDDGDYRPAGQAADLTRPGVARHELVQAIQRHDGSPPMQFDPG